jgi:tetratricopeptide (TPR) repeat protein
MLRDHEHPINSAVDAPQVSPARQRWELNRPEEAIAAGATELLISAGRSLLAGFLLATLSASCLPAQSPPQNPPKPKPNSTTDNATQNAPDQPTWDPLRAEKDIEVGQYYMRKGDVDAAIDRFQDATLAKPGYAIPFRYLGEAQEKKGLKRDAIKSYTRYLDLYPHAEDKSKIEKKIEKLRSEIGKSKK